ncbi:hypothetical protein LCGC14_0786450 [marine sediment metagenome]|uniref:Uncharacterized protein n=1 Tax=marine sediment metagenome TaxID=412755 RepID=A0A0F9SDS4_9ZZZZ|nr:MAG: hypothetical protein Lokiarch_52230 [Candidatus Lokiarchaeum sp. GC14_75]
MIPIPNKNEQHNDNNELKEVVPKDKPIYVKVSEETRALIDKHKLQGTTISDIVKNGIKCYDNFKSISPEANSVFEKYRKPGESNIAFIERGIKYFGDQKDLDRDLWVRARSEMKMMLIGKTTFNQLIRAAEAPKDSLEKPFKKNVGIDLILWYNNSRPLKSLTPEEIMSAVQKMWVVANYFHSIDFKKEGKDQFHMLFRHRQNKRYSAYWLGYFSNLFKSEEMAYEFEVEGQSFDETLSLMIKIGDKK